jgi:hypothetical protein
MKTRETREVVAALLLAPSATKILVTRDGTEISRAVLGPRLQMHRQAAVRLLEGLALWFQRTVRVVLCVDDRCAGSDRSLMDAFGVGMTRLHDEVDIVVLCSERRRAMWRGGHGDFGDLRLALRRALGAS